MHLIMVKLCNIMDKIEHIDENDLLTPLTPGDFLDQ